jgi:hypothetical protein
MSDPFSRRSSSTGSAKTLTPCEARLRRPRHVSEAQPQLVRASGVLGRRRQRARRARHAPRCSGAGEMARKAQINVAYGVVQRGLGGA